MTDITDTPIFYWHESPGNRFRVDVADFDEAAECPHCVPVYSAETVDRLRARVAELESLDRGGWVRTCGADHVVVPRDPTPEMLRAGFLSHHEDFEIDQPADAPGLVYKAMIDAAIDAAKDGA